MGTPELAERADGFYIGPGDARVAPPASTPFRHCRRCHASIFRVHREGVEWLLSYFGLFPYVCDRCAGRCVRLHFREALRSSCLLMLLAAPLPVLMGYRGQHRAGFNQPGDEAAMQAPAAPSASDLAAANLVADPDRRVVVLGNKDIVDLVKSGLTDENVKKVVQRFPHRFDIDPKSLVVLVRSGVSSYVIGVMLDATDVDSEDDDTVSSAGRDKGPRPAATDAPQK